MVWHGMVWYGMVLCISDCTVLFKMGYGCSHTRTTQLSIHYHTDTHFRYYIDKFRNCFMLLLFSSVLFGSLSRTFLQLSNNYYVHKCLHNPCTNILHYMMFHWMPTSHVFIIYYLAVSGRCIYQSCRVYRQL